MNIDTVMERAREAVVATRVYEPPFERDGVTVIPASRIRGGGGGGSEGAESPNAGGGFGVMAAPAGAVVIHDGEVEWIPAVDRNLTVVAGTVVAILSLMTVRTALRRLRR